MKTLLFITLIVSSLNIIGQTNTGTFKVRKLKTTNGERSLARDKAPSYPGGNNTYFKFLKNNIKYNISRGFSNSFMNENVSITFTVDLTGSIKDIEIESGRPPYSTEAVRVIKLMPKWIPGIKNGVNASCPMVVSINFTGE